MMTDPIADMLTRIRNAQMVRKLRIELPFSKMKKSLADVLSRKGYIGKVSVKEEFPKMLVLELKYNGKKPIITKIERESKPGHRKYRKSNELPKILNGFGIAIISTSKGMMTNKEAKEAGIGGEVICSIY